MSESALDRTSTKHIGSAKPRSCSIARVLSTSTTYAFSEPLSDAPSAGTSELHVLPDSLLLQVGVPKHKDKPAVQYSCEVLTSTLIPDGCADEIVLGMEVPFAQESWIRALTGSSAILVNTSVGRVTIFDSDPIPSFIRKIRALNIETLGSLDDLEVFNFQPDEMKRLIGLLSAIRGEFDRGEQLCLSFCRDKEEEFCYIRVKVGGDAGDLLHRIWEIEERLLDKLDTSDAVFVLTTDFRS